MMLKGLIHYVILVFGLSQTLKCQELKNGIYLINPNEEISCYILKPTLSGDTTFCLLKEPIIQSSEYKSIGNIKEIPALKIREMNLYFHEKGAKTLKSITNRLPGYYLGVVHANDLVGTWKITEKVPITILRIWEKKEYDNLSSIRKMLLKSIGSDKEN
ncbi:MAG: hypothetical protein AAF363_13700 [Bacteroidota bacterium]